MCQHFFMKKIVFSKIPKKKKKSEERHCFAFLQISSMFGLREKLDSHICFGIQSAMISQVMKLLDNSNVHS